jgi:cell division initiation protein
MRYTPVELRHVRVGRSFLGYKRDETDRILEDVADSFEEVWRDRGELTDKVEEIEKELAEFKQRETLLANTLISAERAASEAKALAKREAEVIVAEAHQEGRSIIRTAQTERERLFAEARRVETLLRAALGLVEETQSEPGGAEAASSESWPKREDTREFQAVQLAEPEPEPESEAEEDPGNEVPVAAHEDEGQAPGRDFAWR